MGCFRMVRIGAVGLTLFASSILSGPAVGQIVINEFVKEERTAGSGSTTDAREFVELYNSSTTTAVDISGWTLSTWRLTGNATPGNGNGPPGAYYGTDIITVSPATILQPGDYWVMGAASVPNVDQPIAFAEIYQDIHATVMELRSGAPNPTAPDSGAPLIDAVGYDMFRRAGTPTVTTPPTVFASPTAGQTAQIGTGYWGQLISLNVDTANGNVPASFARYRNGKDSNKNGLDFGHLAMTPGASNIAPGAAYTIPDVDALGLSVGSPISTGVHASFVLPRVIDPTQVGPAGASAGSPSSAQKINPKAIPASPQGGNAIIAWDETGGGNAMYSKVLVNKFDLWAYLDTGDMGAIANGESTTYGIGTTDAFYATPDPTNDLLLTTSIPANGNTGVGWMYQKDYTTTSATLTTKLVLVDFNDSGNSKPAAADWTILETIDLNPTGTPEPSDWHHLGLDYDPATGEVTAVYDDQAFTHTVSANRDGNFYVGYRELLDQSPSPNNSVARPPTFDFFEPEDADFDGDNDVDGADFLTWQRNVGTNDGSADLEDGDANGDGDVTGDDLAIWEQQFGPASTAAVQPVPEPGAWALVLIGAALVVGAKYTDCRSIT